MIIRIGEFDLCSSGGKNEERSFPGIAVLINIPLELNSTEKRKKKKMQSEIQESGSIRSAAGDQPRWRGNRPVPYGKDL